MLKLTKADVHSTFAGLCRGDDMRDIGKNIRKLRESKGLTQDQLAEQTGFTRNNISRIENGRYDTRIETIGRILDALELKITFVKRT